MNPLIMWMLDFASLRLTSSGWKPNGTPMIPTISRGGGAFVILNHDGTVRI